MSLTLSVFGSYFEEEPKRRRTSRRASRRALTQRAQWILHEFLRLER